MMQASLTKYKIGLLVIGVFALILLVIVLIQASATKQDNQTYQKANAVANTLNSYVANQGLIPASLAQAGVSNAPNTVSYHKLSSSSYRFCVDYQTKSTNFNASNVETNLVTSALGTGNGSGSSADSSELVINASHNKGQNCQTISPIAISNPLSNNGGSNSNSSSSSSNDSGDPYAKCDSIQSDAAWEQCLNNVDNSLNSPGSSLTN